MPGPTFGFVKLLASSGSHCTKWADEQHRQAGFESRLVPDLPLPFIPTLIGLRAFDLVSSRVWWEAATNTKHDLVYLPYLFIFFLLHCFSFLFLKPMEKEAAFLKWLIKYNYCEVSLASTVDWSKEGQLFDFTTLGLCLSFFLSFFLLWTYMCVFFVLSLFCFMQLCRFLSFFLLSTNLDVCVFFVLSLFCFMQVCRFLSFFLSFIYEPGCVCVFCSFVVLFYAGL